MCCLVYVTISRLNLLIISVWCTNICYRILISLLLSPFLNITQYKDKLKEQDISTLTLLYSGLSVKSIAFYLRITELALRTRKTRYKHFFEENPTPSSAEFIQRLSNGDSSHCSE